MDSTYLPGCMPSPNNKEKGQQTNQGSGSDTIRVRRTFPRMWSDGKSGLTDCKKEKPRLLLSVANTVYFYAVYSHVYVFPFL